MSVQEYQMVRLKVGTYRDLCTIRDGIVRAYQAGHLTGGVMPPADGLTLSDTLQRLIDHVRRDRRRVKKAQRAARARRRATCQQVT